MERFHASSSLQTEDHGIATQNYQKLNGCAGVKEYPVTMNPMRVLPMSDTDFKAHSVPIASFGGLGILRSSSTTTPLRTREPTWMK